MGHLHLQLPPGHPLPNILAVVRRSLGRSLSGLSCHNMPRGDDARQRGQDAAPSGGSASQGSASPRASGSHVGAGAISPPTFQFTLFREGEIMHGVALDDEVTIASRQAAAVSPSGRASSFTSGGPVQRVEFVLVTWEDVPEEWRAGGAAATVAVVLPDCYASRSYAAWYWETNNDARITCSIDGGYERAYGLVATRACLRCLNATGRPTLQFVQLWL